MTFDQMLKTAQQCGGACRHEVTPDHLRWVFYDGSTLDQFFVWEEDDPLHQRRPVFYQIVGSGDREIPAAFNMAHEEATRWADHLASEGMITTPAKFSQTIH